MAQRTESFAGVRRRGVSLLELALVLAIMVTLGAMALPRYGSAAASYRADAAARRITADLTLARDCAYASSQTRTVNFDLAGNVVTIDGISDLRTAAEGYVTRLAEEPYRVRLVSADFGGQTEVAFDIHGRPNSDGQVVIEAGTMRRTIVLDADTGEATVE